MPGYSSIIFSSSRYYLDSTHNFENRRCCPLLWYVRDVTSVAEIKTCCFLHKRICFSTRRCPNCCGSWRSPTFLIMAGGNGNTRKRKRSLIRIRLRNRLQRCVATVTFAPITRLPTRSRAFYVKHTSAPESSQWYHLSQMAQSWIKQRCLYSLTCF